jgi:hypothetical protein
MTEPTERTLTVVIRDEDWPTLKDFATDQRREPHQQAEAFLDQVLAAQRARENGTGKIHSNGIVRRPRIQVSSAT